MGFNEDVWEVCKNIPEGRVSTYGEIARALGTRAYQAVGNALNKNPYGAWGRAGGLCCRRQRDLVPCHRVVNSDGRIGGFAWGADKKIYILKKEGVSVKDGRIVDFENKLYKIKK